MTKPSQSLGGRLPLADPATLTSAQRDLFEALKATWVVYANELGVQATTEDGRLIGPFNAFLLHPEVTAKLSEFQAAEAAHTTLPPRVREVVIIAVGAVWGADYELYAQINVARKAGLSNHAITTLANGGIPEDLSDHEKIAARLARELSTRHRVDEELYREAEQAFGRTGLFDIAALMGLYHTVCTVLTLFEVPAPGWKKMPMSRPPLPPFTDETATQKARLAEDAWNTRDPARVALAYTTDSRWRNRSEFLRGREAIEAFLTRKWIRELDYRLIKEVWAFHANRIAVRFAYEWHDDGGNWFRSYGNENWEFDDYGLMRLRIASINDLPIKESDRKYHWPLGRRPDDHPSLSDLGL
jgi:nuclear transport factor 2 (NTF2) superfamily protein/alkylhydroperoxidase family enzyme